MIPKWLALIPKSNDCSFEDQIKSAQQAKYDGVVFYSKNPEKDSAEESKNENIRIPSSVIGDEFEHIRRHLYFAIFPFRQL